MSSLQSTLEEHAHREAGEAYSRWKFFLEGDNPDPTGTEDSHNFRARTSIFDNRYHRV